MTILVIFAILSAVFTIYLIAPIASTNQFRCYALMLVIPVFSLVIYMKIGSPALLSSSPASQQYISIINEEQNIRKMLSYDKENITLISQLSGIYMKQAKHDEAIALLVNALKNPEISGNKDIKLQLGTAYFAKGLLYAERKQVNKSLEYLQKAYDTSPKDAPFLPDIMMFMDKVRCLDKKCDGTKTSL